MAGSGSRYEGKPPKSDHSWFLSQIAEFSPGYFAMVMATGIISIAADLLGMPVIAISLLYLNILFFAVLIVLFVLRGIFFGKAVLKDLTDQQKGPGFFSLIAALGVLGSQLLLLLEEVYLTKGLYALGGLCWVVFIYTFLTAVTVKQAKLPLEKGINGAWLVATVATQSMATLGTLLAEFFESYSAIILFISLALYFIGCILYLLIISLIFYRFSFFPLKPGELGAPYWINMGAVAITTLAGSTLILHADAWFFLEEISIFLKGFTLFFWCIGTWWIPFLLLLGFWKHVVEKVPFPFSKEGYHSSYWSMVFPLGMYTASTFKLSQALALDFLMVIPEFFIFIAFFGWIGVFIGFLRGLISTLRGAYNS